MSNLKHLSLEELTIEEVKCNAYLTSLKKKVLYHEKEARVARQKVSGHEVRYSWIKTYITERLKEKYLYLDAGAGI